MEKFLLFFNGLCQAVSNKKGPASVLLIEEYGKNPFLILVSCLLSLRTRDAVMIKVSKELFKYVQTPQELLDLDINKLENIIHSVGFYHAKAKTLKNISQILIEKHGSQVPADKEKLLALPGVGIKTTNLVLSEAFDIPAICVDTHVHRISNKIGLVTTQTPEQTELALQRIVPPDLQRLFSRNMVLLGQSPRVFQDNFISKHRIK